MSKGLRIPRRFTEEGRDPYSTIAWTRRDSRITNPDGSVVFEVKDAEVPASWSQVATDIIVSKYFRKAGVPQVDDAGNQILDEDGSPVLGSETSSRQVFDRLATTWRWWGENHGYFASAADAQAFEDEMKYMLANQIASPNSPQWFNTGLAHAYGITGTAQGFWFVDPATGEMTESPDSYSHPAPHACFPAGTRVMTKSGYRAIEKIEAGDQVLTHAGRYRFVTETMQRQVEEDLIRLDLGKLAHDLVATSNHPLLTVRRGVARRRYRYPDESIQPEWIHAGDLKPGDYVVIARPASDDVIPEPVDLAEYALGPMFEVTEAQVITRNNSQRPSMNRFVRFEYPELMRLFGRWLGDGSIGHETRDGELASVNFVFDASDRAGIEDVQALMLELFNITNEAEYAKGQRTAHLRYTRRPLARWFAETFGEGFAGKSIPEFVYHLPRAHRIQLLVGLFLSDGCLSRSGSSVALCFDQSNRDLAEGIWRLLRSLGYSPSMLGGSVRPGGTKTHYRIQLSAKAAVELALAIGIEVTEAPGFKAELHLGEDVAFRVRGVTREPFFGTVYNFQVEGDESYVANGVVVHNCFINGVSDDLVNPGGIMDLWVREARLFKMGSGCTAGDSRIYVAGEGFIKIRDLFDRYAKQGRQIWDFDGKGRYIDLADEEVFTLSLDEATSEYSLDKVELVWSYDVDKVDKLEVRFDTGAKATVSAWHPFIIWDGERIIERRADELRRGDSVLGPNETALDSVSWEPIVVDYETSYFRKSERWSVLIDNDLAWLVGYFIGDGNLGVSKTHTTNLYGTRYEYRRNRLRFFDETLENLARVQRIIERLFGERAAIQPIAKNQSGQMLTYTGRRVTGFFSALFAPGSKTYTSSLPRFVWLGGAQLAKAFMAGLLDSDGSVSQGRATLFTASPELANDVAVLASLHGMGGGVKTSSNGSVVTVVRKSAPVGDRLAVASHMAHPGRKQRLLEHIGGRAGERASCMPLSEQLAIELFGSHKPADWLKVEIGGDQFHLGRLRYEGVVNPRKLGRAVDVLDRQDQLTERIQRIARSVAFVTSVEPCSDDPDFYDLTVSQHSNYLAGEHGLVAIHNTGSNFSQIRAENEKLSGGGKSSGVMGFLRIGDRAAGAIKSGGTTRRAAKMVILDLDHPDIEEFIDWKMHEEQKARVLIQYGGYPADFNGEAYATVSGQNSNNSVRVPNEFIEAVRNDDDWQLRERTGGRVRKTMKARDLWRKVAEAAWACADPGVQFDTIINEWHTSPAGGKIRATNPCAEYVFLDNTACNLASINLVKFYDDAKNAFDTEGYEHAIRLWTIALEISVTMAHFPSREIAQGSYDYRTLGLGYANLGTLLMRMGLPYDSGGGRAVSGAITAILTGYSYATSAELSAAVGPFPRFAENREAMLRVIRNHRRASYNVDQSDYEGLSHYVMGINPELTPAALLTAARQSWDLALDMGERHGFRNAQVSVIAPTGTIGLQMDCDTTGVEPDFSLVKFKKLAGGGYFKIVNQSVTPALENLGYSASQIEEIIRYIVGTSSLVGAPYINRESLMEKGFTDADLAKIEAALPAVFELRHAFNPFVLGEAAMQRLGFEVDEYATFEFDLLRALGFTAYEIREATEWACGQQTIEGAPHLRDEHLAVFDTANRNGRNGQRLIHHTGHIKMLAATQPFLSGAASKTINMPNEATIEDIEESYMLSYELGVKCMALYRDGSKASQPLSSSSDDAQSEDEPEVVTRAHEIDKQILWGKIPAGLSPTQAYDQGMHPPRFLLPARRGGYTQEARIGGHKVYLRTGEYQDGTLGELFIDLAKEGATLRGILSCFAIAVSKGLQFGVPLEEFVDTFTFQTFEPRGLVEGHPNIKMANSIVDYVFRALAVEYLSRDDLAQVPPNRDGELPEPASGLAVEAGVQLDLSDAVAERDVSAVASAVKFLDSKLAAPPAPRSPEARKAVVMASKDAGTAAMQSALGEMMGDAPICDVCGHITIRNGSCYKCLNCGNSLGCS